jgi:hypothetical protein
MVARVAQGQFSLQEHSFFSISSISSLHREEFAVADRKSDRNF